MTLFKEYGNPNLRALNEVQTLKAFTEFADAAGYGVSTSSAQEFIYPAWEYAGTRKSLDNSAASGILKLPDIPIGRSLGAKAKNYDIIDPSTGEFFHFVEGTKIQNAEVFAGYSTRKPLNEAVADGLSREFGGDPAKWQHAKGIGTLDYYGEDIKAEVHWFQEESIGKVKFKVKEWKE